MGGGGCSADGCQKSVSVRGGAIPDQCSGREHQCTTSTVDCTKPTRSLYLTRLRPILIWVTVLVRERENETEMSSAVGAGTESDGRDPVKPDKQDLGTDATRSLRLVS